MPGLALVAFFIGRLVIRWIRKIVRRSFERSGADKGVEQFVDSLLKYGLYALLVFSLISSLGFDTTSVAAVLASGGVAIGLALQGSLSNFAGGVLILLLKPFVVGDYIIEDTNGKEGTVKEIQIFYTKLSTIDNKTIVIPNGMLTNNSITNATAKDERQLDLRVGISYDADIRQAKSVIENLLIKDECIIKNEQINVFVHELADNAVVLGIRAWVKNEETSRRSENIELSKHIKKYAIQYRKQISRQYACGRLLYCMAYFVIILRQPLPYRSSCRHRTE